MEKLSKIIKFLGYLDYFVSASVLGYGLYSQSWLYVTVGGAGLVIAYLQPAERVKGLLMRKFIRTSPAVEGASNLVRQFLNTNAPMALNFRPPRRYAHIDYCIGFEMERPHAKLSAADTADYGSLLNVSTERMNLGVKATGVVPR